MPAPPQTVLIVGGGEYGLSAALALAEGPYSSAPSLITVLDRSASPPSLDAASSDINKIVRSDYSDVLHAQLAGRAIAVWKTPLWSDFYFPSGTVILSSASHAVGSSYVKKALAVNKDPKLAVEGKSVASLDGPEAFQARYPKEVEKGTFEGEVGYFNPHCGWANARGAMDAVCDRVRAAGVSFAVGEAASLVYEDERAGKDVKGVRTKAGETLMADLVILATGSWTASLLPEMGNELLATGQVVATIQLTQEEADQYRSGPVSLCMDTGFYLFPPTSDNIIKFAIHGQGFLNPSSSLPGSPSVPRTTSTPGYEADQIPREAVQALRAGITRIYPGLLEKKWAGTRICWYCDSPSSDWLLDFHPSYPSLFIAAGDSGHGFKFLPIMGELILGALQGTLDEVQKATWGFDRLQVNKGDASRGWAPTERKVLRTEEMVRPDEI